MRDYSVSFILFTECNMNCEFCYQKYKRHKIDKSDIDFIHSIPDKLVQIIEKHDIKDCVLSIGLSGGELFAIDGYKDIYINLCDEIDKKVHGLTDGDYKARHIVPSIRYMSNGLFNVEEVEDLLDKTYGSIDISYDIAGRFKDEETENLVVSNIERLYMDGYNVSITTTLTKQNIDEFVYHGGFKHSVFDFIPIGASYYLPMSKSDLKYCPSANDIYSFYKTAYDSGYTDMDTIKLITMGNPYNDLYCKIGSIISKYTDIDKLDYCGDYSMISDYKKDSFEDIYGHDNHLYGDKKLNCGVCIYGHRCPRMCGFSVLASKYEYCPLQKLIKYIRGD